MNSPNTLYCSYMLAFMWPNDLWPEPKTYPDDKNPLDERKAEPANGPVASSDGISQTER